MLLLFQVLYLVFRLNLEIKDKKQRTALWLALTSPDEKIDPDDEESVAARLAQAGASPDSIDANTGNEFILVSSFSLFFMPYFPFSVFLSLSFTFLPFIPFLPFHLLYFELISLLTTYTFTIYVSFYSQRSLDGWLVLLSLLLFSLPCYPSILRLIFFFTPVSPQFFSPHRLALINHLIVCLLKYFVS